MTDLLEPTSLTIPGQNYALISVVSPDSNQKNDTCAVKIYGIFASKEEADAHARKLTKLEPTFDIFLVEPYKWLPIPPDKDSIESQEYQDEKLNTIIKAHMDKVNNSTLEFEERKKRLTDGKEDPLDSINGSSPEDIMKTMTDS